MQLDTVVITGLLPTRAARVYGAWLDDREHSSFTGGQATQIDAKVGGAIQAGTYSGKLVKLRTGSCIGFTFRTPEFPDEQPDSKVEVKLTERDDGTSAVEITHSQVPTALVPIVESLWLDRYLTPMRMYFASLPELPGERASESGSAPEKAATAPARSKERASSARKAAAKKSAGTKSKSAARASGTRRAAKPAAAKPVPKKKAAAKKSPAKKSRSRTA